MIPRKYLRRDSGQAAPINLLVWVLVVVVIVILIVFLLNRV